jgi:hypothetical protein
VEPFVEENLGGTMNMSGFGSHNPVYIFNRVRIQRGILFGVLIVLALLAFEVFNYSTTDYALTDLLGDLRFAGIKWATILAIAFCGIDFAGIARLFTPEEGAQEPNEVWYLFGAWMLAATMNAMLTWWGVSLAIINNPTLGNAVVGRDTLLQVVPVFVAIMVWLIRVLIIGTFSVAGERLFTQANVKVVPRTSLSSKRPSGMNSNVRTLGGQRASALAAGRVSRPVDSAVRSMRREVEVEEVDDEELESSESGYSRTAPTYHPLSAKSRSLGNSTHIRR